MFQTREEERDYAFLNDKSHQPVNRYGKSIELVSESDPLAGKTLNINGDTFVSDNPNRYKQHGFHFTADNCIGCHACEAACSEKNDNPAHIAFRSVGYVEGGTYPAFKRLNISMACNHCDNPVCLKGCPTRAYTKFAEYGAVLQDPDICFGCGYCTWVCPYNAPQLDPVKGQVSKCNMCVDRLEVGLKPACVSACLGNALNFGVIENTPENRQQAKTEIPGFPRTDITHPNIRFQQTKSLPPEMTRTDSAAVKYHKDQTDGVYKPIVDKNKRAAARKWSLKKLRSREDPLVLFTLISQGVIGAFMLLFLGSLAGVQPLVSAVQSSAYLPMLFIMLGIESFALFISTMHLGKPHRFYRAFNNLKYSPVSREVAGIAMFFNSLLAHTFFSLFDYSITQTLATVFAYAAVITGPIALYFMHKIYRIEARPFWNHHQVLTAFYGNMFTMGTLLTGLVFVPVFIYQGQSVIALLDVLAPGLITGLLIEGLGHMSHTRYLKTRGCEASVSYYEQVTTFGKTYMARNLMLVINILVAGILYIAASESLLVLGVWVMLALSIIVSALVSRALFYVLVIPTTMPGAFFWKNKGFEEHARESGLAQMPQVGVIADVH
ncbi:MAG: dimethyl sulfoxide reductase anchor subunit [Gammaproteobacteria bacterium]|nr:dimethyl sulfoxide reductase anchor subunit [Gammaproteobacteria bacterium]